MSLYADTICNTNVIVTPLRHCKRTLSRYSAVYALQDELIERLGGVDAVAEMSGRRRRMVKQPNGTYKYCLRSSGEGGLDKVRLPSSVKCATGLGISRFQDSTCSSPTDVQSARLVVDVARLLNPSWHSLLHDQTVQIDCLSHA